MRVNLIFPDVYQPYALMTNGDIVQMPCDNILEICDDLSTLECRKSQWEAYYKQNSKSIVKPPWIEE